MSSFFSELKRRNVVRVGIAYAITAWIVVEIASVVMPIFNAPPWILQVFTLLIILGAPFALIFAWAFELTPDGLKRTADVPADQSTTPVTGRKLDFVIIGILVVAVVILAVDKIMSVPEEAPPTETVATGRPSIAILPFANRSANEQDVFFVDGIHDDLLSHVSKIKSIKTISRTSVLQYRDTNKTIPQIAEELGVATVLEGGIQRAGDQVRINVQLIDAAADEHLWSEIYDRQLTAGNIFSIQSEIATAVAGALRTTLSPEEQNRIEKVPTENLEALEVYFQGKQLIEKRTTVALAQAVEYFQQAVSLDPDFALAYVRLADTYRLQVNYSGLPADEMNAKGQAAIDRALQLDPNLGEAHTALANLLVLKRDISGADAAFKRALALDPNYASANQWYGEFLAHSTDRLDEALMYSRRAIELDPLSPIINTDLAEVLEIAGYFDEAMSYFEQTIEIDPTFALGYGNIGELYWRVYGEVDKAIHWLTRSYSLDVGHRYGPIDIGLAYLNIGDHQRALQWLELTRERMPESWYLNFSLANLYLSSDQEDRAIEYSRKAAASRPHHRYILPQLGNLELRAGRTTAVLALYKANFPEFFDNSELRVNRRNFRQAIGLATVLLQTDDLGRADSLLERSHEVIQSMPRLGRRGFGISDVRIYALRGQNEQALAALRQAVDERWRMFWRESLGFDTSLNSIRDDPRFQAIVDEIETEMANQLARVRDMEARGEIVIPVTE
jgi:TolB-like protein/Tfp pilus assembly protein PilF